MSKEKEARIQLTTEEIREAVWEWLNFHQLVKRVAIDDIAFSEEFVTAHVRAVVGPR